MVANLNPASMRKHKQKRAKRAAEAKKRFQQPQKEVAWKCRTWREEKGQIVGRECARPLAGGFGGKGKARVQKANRVVLLTR